MLYGKFTCLVLIFNFCSNIVFIEQALFFVMDKILKFKEGRQEQKYSSKLLPLPTTNKRVIKPWGGCGDKGIPVNTLVFV